MQNIIELYLTGGLGNQLFQISYAIKIQEKYGADIILNEDWFKNNKIRSSEANQLIFKDENIEVEIPKYVKKIHKWLFISSRIIYKLNGFFFKEEKIPIPLLNLYSYLGLYLGYNIDLVEFKRSFLGYYSLHGYFQWPKSLPSQNNLKKKIPFLNRQNSNLKKNNFNNCDFCVCLRIGKDYINAKDICIDYLTYLESSFKIAKEKYPNATFHIFADDYSELKNIKLPAKSYINYESDIFNKINQMSLFNNFIIMNSSFAWWPIYFSNLKSNSIVIMPKIWYKKYKKNCHPMHEFATHLV